MSDSDVFILGAGFSRALSNLMPLTDELGNLCLEDGRLRSDPKIPPEGFTGGNFETWLSRLADEQPYLSAEENLENQALFLRFSAAIADVLGRRVDGALNAGWPQWFPEFLRIAHYRRVTLVTFNYDPLIECGVAAGLLDEWGNREPVFWAEVIGDVPSWAAGSMRFAAVRVDTFRLLKMHGSLNWYWSPGDETGVSIARRDLPGRYGDATAYNEEDRRRELPGRVPFVVPPSATKSPYYRNPLLREVWQQALAHLREASRVIIMGYSLPPADLTFAGMLVDALRDTESTILIIDPAATSVAERLSALGFSRDRIVTPPSPTVTPISCFVANWRGETGRCLTKQLSTLPEDILNSPILIHWNRDAVAPVVEVKVSQEEAVVELATEDPQVFHRAVQMRSGRAFPELPTLRDVAQKAGNVRILVTTDPNGSRHTIITYKLAKHNVGHGSGNWILLIPSGKFD